ncbi:integrase core domain-containing protein [Corallincola platygyrae]
MPWIETCVMDQKIEVVGAYLKGGVTITALASAYGVSRKTIHKWVSRYEAQGPEGLAERSRAPKRCPHATDDVVVAALIDAKQRFPSWGPKKLIDLLRQEQPDCHWPADSTAGEILKRFGLVKKRRVKRKVPADGLPFSECNQSNQCWSADFKGDFRLGNKQRCYPLTITDNYSRYLLTCRSLPSIRYQDVRGWFEWVFREYGLPDTIRTDNGVPFASRSLGGLSQLSKMWIDQGIRPERIKPGRPQQNGRHERMHRSLKDAVCKQPGYSLLQQQRRFDRFVQEYNELRSHEGLERQTPASVYVPSNRVYSSLILPPEYDSTMTVRSIRHNGEMKWLNEKLYVSELLAKTRVGLLQTDNHLWDIYYRFQHIGRLNERTMKIEQLTEWRCSTFEKV